MGEVVAQNPSTTSEPQPAVDAKGADVPALADPAKGFLQEEQKQRRAEIENILAQIKDDQRYALILTGGVWSWFAANQSKIEAPVLYIMLCLPALITFFFMWRWKNLHACLHVIAKYTMELEQAFQVPDRWGWERWLHAKDVPERRRASLQHVYKVFWLGLLGANALIGVLVLVMVLLYPK